MLLEADEWEDPLAALPMGAVDWEFPLAILPLEADDWEDLPVTCLSPGEGVCTPPEHQMTWWGERGGVSQKYISVFS
jgi:hypothetical protein